MLDRDLEHHKRCERDETLMPLNIEVEGSELRQVGEGYPEYRSVLCFDSNSDSEIIQRAGIEDIQYQFRIPGCNIYIQTGCRCFLVEK